MAVKEDTWLCLTRIVNKHFIRNFTVEVSVFVVKQYYRNLTVCWYKLKVDKEDTHLCLTRIVNKHFIRNFTVEVSDFVVKQYYRN